MSKSFVDRIERNAQLLHQLDWDRPDQMITKNEFDTKVSDLSGLNELVGGADCEDWSQFKEAFLQAQSEIGFNWSRARGRGGPVVLDDITLPAGIGHELAKTELARNTSSGDFNHVLQKEMPQLFSYLTAGGGIDSAFERIDAARARTGFKEFNQDNRSYKFKAGRNSTKFELSILEYSYHDPNSKGKRGNHEFALGEGIEAKLKTLLDLDELSHTQHERGSRSLENADFEGFRIQRHVEGDRFLMYSFELKPSNGIRAVSDAISQAINYKGRSHFSYIIIPLFDQYLFHDPDRLDDLLELCRTNQIGAISIDVDTDTGTILDVSQVLKAAETPLEDSDRLSRMIDSTDWEMCPLCRRIVDNTNRGRCGWLVESSDTSTQCMKEVMQERMVAGA